MEQLKSRLTDLLDSDIFATWHKTDDNTLCGLLVEDGSKITVLDRMTGYTDTVSIGGRVYTLEVDGTKPHQPKKGANKMRVSGACNLHGLCENFVKCGDADFLGECLGPSFKNLDVACPDAY